MPRADGAVESVATATERPNAHRAQERWTWLVVLPGLLLAAAPARQLLAQVVRGVVREAESARPLAGVLVALESATESSRDETPAPAAATGPRTQLAVLSNEQGGYELRVSAPGAYVVTAKRIGAMRHRSEPISLAPGETRAYDITLERVRYELPRVAVTTTSPCARKSGESARIASLWDEVRTALSASQISARDRLARTTVTRYARTLQPRTMRVRTHEQNSRTGVASQPFVSIDPDTLSSRGFAWIEEDGSLVYYAPDAEVLLSDAFLRDHCFSLTVGRDSTAGMLGLAFEPVPRRRQPEVLGTLWVDARTFELRFVAFRYQLLPMMPDDPEARGEVRFERLPNGAWIVSRWFIRMPQVSLTRLVPLRGAQASVPSERAEVVSYREEGGDAQLAMAGARERLAALDGVLRDSTGRASLRGSTVRLDGTAYTASVRPDGRFTLDSLPPGDYTLVAEHADYAALGVTAAEQELSIEGARRSQTLLQALTTSQLLRLTCDADALGEDRAALRVVLGNEPAVPMTGTDSPAVATLMVRVTWAEYSGSGGQPVEVRKQAEGTPDERGAVMLCDLPARTILQVQLVSQGRPLEYRHTLRLTAGTLTAHLVRR
ncbi:MAG: carboxypeptidase-like regulatory domain-containing protein [Gemmatimonadaceae bacterium]